MTADRDSAPRQALILFAHGSRDPEWATPFHRIRDIVAARRPDLLVEQAYLEFMTPTLADALDRAAQAGATRIAIAPLFMAQGGHLKHDLPRLVEALRARHAGARIRLLPPIGETESVLAAIGDWLIAALSKTY